MKKVCVIGLGYIGLPTAALLANKGYEVHGVDIVQSTINIINSGKIHIVEPELDTFVKSAVNMGKLKADSKPIEADIFIIAVPTPFHEGYVPNIDYVLSATKSIASYVKEGNIVILESTSPVGTTDRVEEVLKEEGVDTSKIYIAHCPERVLPGHIMRELVENDRIVGGTTAEATAKTVAFYNTFVDGEVLSTTARTAEMAKLTENSFRDSNIAFANELSMLCDTFDIDIWELISLANRHPRVNILQPASGVGGHCIAVDPWFVVHAAKESGVDAKMIRTAREVNTYKTEWVIEKIKNEALLFEQKNRRKAKVACMGLAFKPNIDDLRESPALYIAQRLTNELENLICIEPNISSGKLKSGNTELEVIGKESFDKDNSQLSTLNSQLESVDIVAFLVGHKEFKDMNNLDRVVLDFCGAIN